ncbi:MAG: hypothetical protein M1820_004537 [Bogoriella megaspora]|nr:MAG: hypothetical protein M1820_004537 [Bogoriella megaspora]
MEARNRPRRLVGTSLKMYFDLAATMKYVIGAQGLDEHAKANEVDLFVIPDYLAILPAREQLKNTNVMLGAQDAFWEDNGPYTGEVSPLNLSQAGVKIVEIGHAERRKIFGETDEHVAKKAAAAVRNQMIPLICIGEKTQRSIASAAVGVAVEECRAQIIPILSAVPSEAEIILAYEPVWAIGAKEPANPDHVINVAKEIRKLVANRSGVTRILYGGSAGPGTFERLKEGVDGLFLGRFAHDIDNLKQVITELGSS